MQHAHILKKLNFNQVRGQGQSDHKMAHETPPSTHQRDSYLNQMGDMLWT